MKYENTAIIMGSISITCTRREGVEELKRKKRTRGLSIRSKILFPTSILIMALCVIMGVSAYMRTKDGLIAMGVEEAQMAAKISVKVIDGDALEKITREGVQSSGYGEMLSTMRDIREECGIKYLYTLYTDGKQVYYGIDTDETESCVDMGEPFEASYQELQGVFAGQGYVQGFIDYTENGELISAYMPVMDGSGARVVGVVGCDYDASGVVGHLNTILWQVAGITVICMLIVLLIINVIVTTIIRSLRAVDQKIYELVNNEGDLTQRLEVHTGDEMELIANNVNDLLSYIRNIMLNISKGSKHLNGSSTIIAEDLAHAEMSITDVSATMEQMSAAMEESSSSLDQVNEAIVQIFELIEGISSQAESGNTSSGQIMEHAGSVYHKAAEEQQNAKIQAAEMVQMLQQKIEKSRQVEEVRELTKNIIDITEETNLLSLNASIEAAKAGEAGRGFVVVADEIGKLALNSAQAAARIQKVTSDVIKTVDELAEEAEEMVHFMNETAMGGYSRLLQVSETYQSDVGKMNQMMWEFAEESRQLKEQMDMIKTAIGDLRIAVSESAQGVSSVTEKSVDLTNNVGGIGEEANSNMDIANQLNQEVSKFKV